MNHERDNLMKHSLEKWGHAPIILGGASTHLFGGSSTHYFKRARALIIQESTSTHHLKNSQTENKWMDTNEHERNKVHEMLSWKKWGRAPIILGGASTHLFEGSSTHYLGGLEHSLFKRARALIVWRAAKQRTSEWMQNEHERNKVPEVLLWKNEGAHPLF